jgi:hypothetical protein
MSCRLSYNQINGMSAVTIENDFLFIGLLPGRGSDIYKFHYKPLNQDFLLDLKKGIRNPLTHFSQIRDTNRQFEDYYYGGWQVCFPNSPAFNYRGAELGQHGEVSLIPWEMEVITDSPEEIKVTCSADVLRLPLGIRRTFIIRKNDAALYISEEILNYGAVTLDIMWGQHIAFGLPFIRNGVKVTCNARTLEAEDLIPAPHLLERNQSFTWPDARTSDGMMLRADEIPPQGEGIYSELAYMEGFPAQANYSVSNDRVTFQLHWDGELFKTCWMWQERNAIQDFPWWGDCFTLALEPWTSRWTALPKEAIAAGEWLKIESGQRISTGLTAKVIEKRSNENI